MDYKKLIEHFKSPLAVALALGFCKHKSSYLKKHNAASRVGMWKHNGIPKKHLPKIEAITSAGTPPSAAGVGE